MKKALLLWLFLSSVVWAAEVPVTNTRTDDGRYGRGSAVFSTSGDFARFQNANAAYSGTVEIIITGGPATVSIPIVGCAKGGTCHAAAATYTGTTTGLQAVTFDSPYDVWKITPAWTGGTSVTVTVNIISSVANSHTSGPGGGGTWGTITGTLSDQTDLNTALAAKEATANKDAASGYAGLTAGSLLKVAELPALTGDVTSSAGSAATTLASIVTGATNTKVTYDAKGRVTAGAQAQFSDLGGSLAATQLPALTGDITSSAGSAATTLASIVTGATNTKITYDAKGRVTAGAQAQFSDIGGSVAAAQTAALAGDVTKVAGNNSTVLANIPDLVTQAGSILATNIAAPTTPAAGKTKVYVDSITKKLCSKDDAGAVNCVGGSVSAPGSSGQILNNSSGALGAIGDTSSDSLTSFAGANSVGLAVNRIYTNADNTHSGHGFEPTVKITGSGIPNTLAGLYSTAIYGGSGGGLHIGPIMGRGTDAGTGGTVTDFDLAYFDYNSSGSPTDAVTRLTWLKLAGGNITGGAGNNYGTICGLCYILPVFGGSTAVTLQEGVDIGMPSGTDSRLTSHIGVSIGGGRDAGNYDAQVIDGGMSYFKQGIKQSLTLDSTLFSAPITTGGVPVSGIVGGIYQSNFATAAQSAANMNSLLTAPNGFTGSLFGVRQVTDNGGSGLTALLNPFYGKCGNSGAATTTTCEAFTADTPGNSGATLTNTIAFHAKNQASGTQTNTAFAFKSDGATDIVQIAGPARAKRIFANQGTAIATGDLAISGGWGSTASKASFTGFDQAGSFTVTSSGTGQAANPTITLTFHDGTWTNAPVCQMWQNGGTGTIADLQNTTESATAPVFTYVGTPVSASTYRISWHCWGV